MNDICYAFVVDLVASIMKSVGEWVLLFFSPPMLSLVAMTLSPIPVAVGLIFEMVVLAKLG